MSSHKTALLQKEQQALHLEDKERQLQKEVRSPKVHSLHFHSQFNQAMLKIRLWNLVLVTVYIKRRKWNK